MSSSELMAPHPPAQRDGPTTPSSSLWQRQPWLREPLLHFLLLGAALFAVDHVLIGRADDPRVITIGPEVDKEARELFKNSRGVDPTPEQLAALRQVWLDNEVLYREGLALRVNEGDSAIRDRVVFKALNVVEGSLRSAQPDVKTLRTWFEANRAKYDEPPRFDFQEAVLTADNSEGAVRAFVAELNRGSGGELRAGLRVFKGRPHSNLVQSYGEDFAKTLEQLQPGQWQALQTRDGWRAMRLDAAVPGKPADFDTLAAVVQQDWVDETMAAERTAAVRALAKKYTVRTVGAR
jgi:hypothetical protein